jgi:thiamine-monophosphate kinase
MKLALSGGEDFELLLTVPEAEVGKLPETIPAGAGTALIRIGKIVEQNRDISIRGTDGEISSLPAEGYDHFRRPFSKSISKHMD